MKILIVDRDEMAANMIKSKLEPYGHSVVIEAVKNDAIERAGSEDYDLIFLDPTPLTSARPVVLNIRRSVPDYPYIVLTSETGNREEALKAGMNDILSKPLDSNALDEKLQNAERLLGLVRNIGDDSEDFPSAGGVIAKSAFNQLFLSALDRADRYGELTYVLFITMTNYPEILQMDGPYAAEYAVAKLSQYLVRLRRQSDIIGQTGKNQYALLLQRPLYETEPVEAAKRFGEAMSKYDEVMSVEDQQVQIQVQLVDLPIGRSIAEYDIMTERKREVS